MKLHIKNLNKSFKKNKVIIDASYTFEQGKIYGLLGRNGAGKTTFFNMIYSELKKDSGEILLEDEGVVNELDIKDVGMVFAESFLPEFLTGYEYIKFVIDIKNPMLMRNIDEYFDMMDLRKEDREKLIKEYSSGMKSKINLLALYIQRPKVILLDEPLTAVDVVSGSEIKKFFKEMKDDHIIILSTHMLDLAKDICDEIVLLNEGKLESLSNLEKDSNYETRIIEALRDKNVESN